MIKLYLDSNIYRIFKSSKEDKYIELSEKLLKNKDEILIFYSPAHINDLRQDKTEKKYNDLKFMSNYTDDNFLSYNIINNLMTFEKLNPINSYYSFSLNNNETETVDMNHFDIDKLLMLKNLPIFNDFSILFDTIEKLHSMKQPEKINISLQEKLKNQSIDIKNLYKKFGIVKDEYEFDEWKEITNNLVKSFDIDPNIYKEVRRVSKNYNEIEKFNVTIDNFNFNDDLKKTIIGKSFFEIIDELFVELKKVPLFDSLFLYYTMCYSLLNALGVDNEINKKVKFRNTITDSQHSFYGASCDYVITNDLGLINKSIYLYNHFNYSAKVLHIDDFITIYSSLVGQNEKDIDTFHKLLCYDIKNGLIVNQSSSLIDNFTKIKIKTNHLYFGYFNNIEVNISKSINIITFYHNYNSPTGHYILLKELNSVIKILISIFGFDKNLKNEFLNDEINEFQNGNWQGRIWIYGKFTYRLEYLFDLNLLVFRISIIS